MFAWVTPRRVAALGSRPWLTNSLAMIYRVGILIALGGRDGTVEGLEGVSFLDIWQQSSPTLREVA
jgi:hypothetical protein